MADQSNPWGTTEAADSAAQSADAWGSTPAPADGGGAADWLNSAPAPAPEHFNIMDPFHKTLIPLDSWVTEGIDWVVTHFRPVFRDPHPGGLHPERLPAADAGHARAGGDYPVLADRMAVRQRGYGDRHADLPDCHRRDWRVVSGDDHPLVLTALLFCVVIGLPMGIWLARSPGPRKLSARCWMRCRPRQRSFTGAYRDAVRHR